mmetsp:Transcript_54567/g.122541  ORF Transcript_54567/g.122541 Transcript_54567/m.122541 type:complete len:130 (+) Transcript_54567:1170-1559(+)
MEGLDFQPSLVSGAEGALCLLNLTSELLDGALVGAHVLAALLLEDLHEVLHDSLVKVLSTQVGVTVGGNDLKDAVVDGEQGDIECATTKVIDQDVLLSLLVEAIGNCCCGWLVDDTKHVQTSNQTSILC